MVTSHVGTAEATAIAAEFRRLEKTVETVFWDVTWTAWTKDRPEDGEGESWNAGTAEEEWAYVGTGTGRLRENGAGGPVIGEDVIYPESPYRLRTLASAPLTGNTWLVIEGSPRRLFKVDAFKPRGGERTHASAYITEVFADPDDETLFPPAAPDEEDEEDEP